MERMKRTKTPVRLDQWLAQKHSDESRSAWQKRIKRGDVRVNGKKVSPHYLVYEEDKIEIRHEQSECPSKNVPPGRDTLSPPLPAVLFEDKNYLVINKPAGLVVHPGSGHHGETLVDWLKSRTQNLSHVGGENRPGIVHRLDKDTSGVMVVAKNDKTHRMLAEQFSDKKVKKTYIALVHGHLEPSEGSIEAPLTRNAKNRTKITVSAGKKSRYALTHYRVEKQFSFPFEASLLAVTIETGRTHQIRVHFEAIGHPVVGDAVYMARSLKKQEEGLEIHRQFLHAKSLEFTSPTTNKEVKYSTEMPAKLEKTMKLFS